MTRKITISYAIYEPEHEGEPSERGWMDEAGVEFDSVLEAAVWLQKQGAVYPSSTVPSQHMWFYSELDTDLRTGRETERSFHPEGFSDRELATLSNVVHTMPRLGHPDSLEYCWADDWREFAHDLAVDDDGVIVSSPDPSLVGMPVVAAYVERFAVDRGESVDWNEGPDGTECVCLGVNDAVYFSTLDRPVLVRHVSDTGISYSLETKTFLDSHEKSPQP